MSRLQLSYPALSGDTRQQLQGIRSYLYELTDRLNLADWSAPALLEEIGRCLDAPKEQENTSCAAGKEQAAVRSLVIKTADYAAKNSETLRRSLRSDYVAVSDFGRYWQEATMTVEGCSFGVEQLFHYCEGVNNAYGVDSRQYVKTGLLYYDGVKPVYGVGVGNLSTTVTDDNETVLDCSRGELLTVTPQRLSFWQSGREVGYIAAGALHLPAAHITGGSISIGDGAFTVSSAGSVSATDMQISGSSWNGGSIQGASINIGDGAFQVDGEGNLSIGSRFQVSSSGAVSCSYLSATGGSIGGCPITGGSLQVSAQHIQSVSAESISAGNVYGLNICAGLGYSGDYASMNTDGLYLYKNGQRKVQLGINPDRVDDQGQTYAPRLRLGNGTADLIVQKHYLAGEGHVAWIGNSVETTGIKINLSSGAVSVVKNGVETEL